MGNYKSFTPYAIYSTTLKEGRIDFNKDTYKGSRITFHDPCYLGRANNEYQAPREILSQTNAQNCRDERSKNNALCCGAGGAQMFKEPEKGNMDINVLRTQGLETPKYHSYRLSILQYYDDRWSKICTQRKRS